jgi:hypothetical protein
MLHVYLQMHAGHIRDVFEHMQEWTLLTCILHLQRKGWGGAPHLGGPISGFACQLWSALGIALDVAPGRRCGRVKGAQQGRLRGAAQAEHNRSREHI